MKLRLKPERFIAMFLVLAASLQTVILLRYGMFTVPLSDDFTFFQPNHDCWERTGSVWQVITLTFRSTKWSFFHWSGEMLASFFRRLSPGLGAYAAYRYGSWIMILLLVVSVYLFWYFLCVRLLQTNKTQWLILASVFFITMIQMMPDIYDLLYWWNTSSGYTIYYCIRLFAFVILLLSWTVRIFLKIILSVRVF